MIEEQGVEGGRLDWIPWYLKILSEGNEGHNDWITSSYDIMSDEYESEQARKNPRILLRPEFIFMSTLVDSPSVASSNESATGRVTRTNVVRIELRHARATPHRELH
jgi:hypothetical protein